MAGRRQPHHFDLFVSYATEDLATIVSEVIKDLYRAGITNIWWDRLSIGVGESIPQKVDDGLKWSKYLLAIVTPLYFQKTWTRVELDAAQNLGVPVIPVWVDVTKNDVARFSPILATRKAIADFDTFSDVAEQIAGALLRDESVAFTKFKDKREELILYWGMAWLYVRQCLGILEKRSSRQLGALDRRRGPGEPTWKERMRTELALSQPEIREMRQRFPMLTDEDASLAILAIVKRKKDVWFPTYPNELEALKKAGIDTW